MTIFFNTWESVLRALITAIIIYPLMIVGLRLVGKRSLSKLNPFDFMVTVAVGSIFGAVIIYESITISDGIVSIGLLLLMQVIILQLSMRWQWVNNWIRPNPTLIYFNNEFLEEEMKSVKITRSEILAECRRAGYICLDDVYAAVLETNGVISILGVRDENINQSTLSDIDHEMIES